MFEHAVIFRHNTAEVSIDLLEGWPRIRYQTDAGAYWWRFMSLAETVGLADLLVRAAENWPSSPPTPDAKKPLACSFCGKSADDVAKLIAGPHVYICDECSELCMDIVNNSKTEDENIPIE